MKKTMVRSAVMAVAGVGLLAGGASAGPYAFEDMIDNWTVLGLQVGAAPIVEGCPLSYTHNINDSVDFAAGDTVTEAFLELDFTNDWDDSVTRLFGRILWDNREFASYAFDGSSFVDVGEVDAGQYNFLVNVDWLNDDGFLDVTLSISNPGWNCATAWLDHSRLYGTAETAAVPEPATMLLFGTGIAGLVGISRRRKAG